MEAMAVVAVDEEEEEVDVLLALVEKEVVTTLLE